MDSINIQALAYSLISTIAMYYYFDGRPSPWLYVLIFFMGAGLARHLLISMAVKENHLKQQEQEK